PQHAKPTQTPPARAAARLGGWPVGLHAAAGLSVLRSVESSSSKSSSLLLAAGIALLLIVIAEASFLRLPGPRLGTEGGAAPRRAGAGEGPAASARGSAATRKPPPTFAGRPASSLG